MVIFRYNTTYLARQNSNHVSKLLRTAAGISLKEMSPPSRNISHAQLSAAASGAVDRWYDGQFCDVGSQKVAAEPNQVGNMTDGKP